MNILRSHGYVSKSVFFIVLLCLLLSNFGLVPIIVVNASTDSLSSRVKAPSSSCVPTITITAIPPFGSMPAHLKGEVDCVNNTDDFKVAVYIYIHPENNNEGSWWIKPRWDDPITPVNESLIPIVPTTNPDGTTDSTHGTWDAKVYTCCVDNLATQYVAFLLPNGKNPSQSGPIFEEDSWVAVLRFKNQLYRTFNSPETVTFTNNQGSSITLGALQGSSSVGTTKLHSKDFFIENDNCSGVTLPASAKCTFDVRFLPWSLGAKTGTITIPSNATNGPYIYSLTGTAIPGTQLLQNRSFENYDPITKLPNLWFKNPGFKIGIDGVDSSCVFHGTHSVKLVGDGDLKIMSQMVDKSGVPGDDFLFSLVTCAKGIPNDADRWLMQVMFYNGSTIVENRNVKLKTGTYNFNRITQTYTATTNYTHIMFRIQFGKSSGTAWFDLSSLQWAP